MPDNFFTRDDNHVPITYLGLQASKTLAFTGAAGLGAVGTVTLFTITGTVAINVIGYCTEDLVSAGGGTVAVGTSSSTAALCDQQNATAVDNHDVWHDSTLSIGGAVAGHIHVIDQNVILTVGTGDVTDGTIVFYALWSPFSSDGAVTAA